MFGHRSDGYLVKHIDPIVALTPYIMPMRCDAQVMMDFKVDYEKLARYIVAKGGEGHRLTFMDILIAAFVRTVAELPELNRFIINKRTYARKTLSVSFAVLKTNGDKASDIEENTVKCYFDPTDTIFDVADRVADIIDMARKEDADNATLKLAQLLLRPVLANLVVWYARLTDRYGIMPKYIVDASPFHTSLFVTNMASIGMPAVKHHIYNFGSTTMFWSIGAPQRGVEIGPDGKPQRKRYLPIGVNADERVAPGRVFAMMVSRMMKYLAEPELLETPPETVNYDENHEFGLPKPKRHFWSRDKGNQVREDHSISA